LRPFSTTSFADGRLAGLVHDGVLGDPIETRRQAHFILTRLLVGVGGLAVLPAFLLLSGRPSLLDAGLAVCLTAPVVAAVVASRTGRLAPAQLIAVLGTAGLVGCLLADALATGRLTVLLAGLAAFMLAEPLDANLIGRRRGGAMRTITGAAAFALGTFIVPGGGLLSANAGLALLCLVAAAAVTAVSRTMLFDGPEPVAAKPDPVDEPLLGAFGDLVLWHGRGGDVVRARVEPGPFGTLTLETVCGEAFFTRVHVPDRPAYLKALSDAANGTVPVATAFRLRLDPPACLDGTARPARSEVIAVEMHARRGHDGDVIAVIRDVSVQKLRADAIEAAHREVERADVVKARFLATVSHELRTPLTAIIGFAELLSMDTPFAMTDERRKEYAEIIRGSGHHLLDVVNTLLDMSKIESGHFPLTPEPFGLADLAHECCDLLQLKAREGNVTIERRVGADMPAVMADRRAVCQILTNLLSNAVKFTPPGGVATVMASWDAGEVVLSVSDTGIGVSEADLAKLGQPFFQAGDGYRRPHEGTGLGLSVVRGLVGLHRGTMEIESGPAAGTTVTVTLPPSASAQALESEPESEPIPIRIVARRDPGLPIQRRSA
jgi:cell cycle sensor histidine kinase DivJ